jgi:hypothetical protein
MLPADWKRYREEINLEGNRPDTGVARSLMLRHFAEKQRVIYEDSTALFETVQHVPLMFEEALAESLDQVVALTEPMRVTLRHQVETGRMLPQFKAGELVRILELYTYLTGNPFVAETRKDVRRDWVSRYQKDYDPAVFDELRADQLRAIDEGKLLPVATYMYLRRLEGLTFRNANGTALTGKKRWSDVYVSIGELEDFLTAKRVTKRSDVSPMKLANGELAAWELMFLMPKRALSDCEDEGLCDITRFCSVGRMDRQMITWALSGAGKASLFSVYGQTDEDRQLSLRPHSLRHLQNTELFRLGVADTIITKRFNRRKLAQTYDYDHRSLAEDLDAISLKPEVEIRLGEKSATVARLIKAGKASGPIVKAFKAIQREQGEDAAIDYLRVEADGFHSTPYGHCINSFTVDPCSQHLECFNGCRHLTATNLTENELNLVQLEGRLQAAVHAIEERQQSLDRGAESTSLATISTGSRIAPLKVSGIGIDNQLAHAKNRLNGVRQLLATSPGQQVFPDGVDLSKGGNRREGTVLDDIL